ncbi:MAG: MotA/TolQ/ExbB proton channel family protein [Kiritimatiellae bacterium]|nr:MotA/TolQ/ExbB proton channel family protein [Kiritimatiellia bacterium]
MHVLTEILLQVSNGLLVPVVVLLLGLFALTTVYTGGLIAEGWERHRNVAYHRWIREVILTRDRRVNVSEIPSFPGIPMYVSTRLAAAPHAGEKILDDAQLYSERLLARLGIGIRLGPVLGLAGTLIPLGPALLALSTGDIAALASKLVVAFTTTVLGLLIGGVSHVLHTVRKNWYMQDLNDLEHILAHLEISE